MIISRNGYTDQEIINALLDERRELDFRIDLLDSNNAKLKEITTIDKLTVSYSKQDRDINRTLKASYKDDLGFTERFEFDHSAEWVLTGNGSSSTFIWDTANGELLGLNGFDCQLTRDQLAYKDVELEMASNQMHFGGLIARFQDQNNFYLLGVSDDTAGGANNLIIYKKLNGNFTLLAISDQTFVRGGPTATIAFRVEGTHLKAFYNGALVLDVTDTSITAAGGVGIWCNNATVYDHYQYFSCTSLDTVKFLNSRMQPYVKLLMPALTNYTATSQADFQAGTLTSVTANSNGTITLGASAPYNTSGNWVSPAYSVNAVGYLKSSFISWSADVPAACTLTVDVKIGSGSYVRATNGGPLPGLSVGDNLAGKTVTLKVSMTTSNTSQTATLNDISIRFLSSNSSTWIEFPQGVFVMPTARPNSTAGGTVTYQIDGYDLNHLLGDTVVKNRYYVAAGTNYVTAIKAALATAGITSYNIDATTSIMPTSLEWEPGTTYYQIVDDLCAAIGYLHYFDENGQFIAQAWTNPLQQTPIFSFKTDKMSLVESEATLELDAYGVPNTVVLIVSEPELTTPLRSERSNNNPDSPTSISNRGREIVRVIKGVQAADQTALDALATQTLFQLSQIYESVEFKAGIVPVFGHNDTVYLEFDPFRLRARYEVLGWEIDMRPGGDMKLNVRRIVTV
jgi:hypothetical protein